MTQALMAPPGSKPLHAHLREVMLDQINSGLWQPDCRIASEREICEQFKVSRTTARRAIGDLTHEGHLFAVQGKGTFVAKPPLLQPLEPLVGFTEDMRRRGVSLHTRVISINSLRADDGLAERLKLRSLTPVFVIARVRSSEGRPIAFQRSHLPEHLCPGLMNFDLAKHSLYEILRTEYGLKLDHGKTRLSAALANAEERKLLELGNPWAVMRGEQTTFLEDGSVIEYCASSYVGERFELTVGS